MTETVWVFVELEVTVTKLVQGVDVLPTGTDTVATEVTAG
jgi:hypothetical protein